VVDNAELSQWGMVSALSILKIIDFALILVFLAGGGYLVLQVSNGLVQAFPGLFNNDTEVDPSPPKNQKPAGDDILTGEVKQVNETIFDIDTQIKDIRGRRGNAIARLEKIRDMVDELTRMVMSIAGKAAAMSNRRKLLIRLRDAIRQSESPVVAEILGELGDQSLKALLLDQNNCIYLDRVTTMISSEIGNLQGRKDALVSLVQVWVDQIGAFREEVVSMKQIVESSEALPIILQIQDNLDQARRALGMTQGDVQMITINRRIPDHILANSASTRMIDGPR
jgi:hypothetical protein